MTEIVTARLSIRKALKEETRAIAELNDPDRSSSYLNSLSVEDRDIIFQDTEAVKKLLALLAATVGNGDALSYGAWLDAEMIGYVTLNNCMSEMPDLQIEMAPAYQGKGYGYEFLSALIDYLFITGYKKFRYAVMPSNAASIALVEKSGGVLQNPESEAERLLLKTYHIVRQ